MQMNRGRFVRKPAEPHLLPLANADCIVRDPDPTLLDPELEYLRLVSGGWWLVVRNLSSRSIALWPEALRGSRGRSGMSLRVEVLFLIPLSPLGE